MLQRDLLTYVYMEVLKRTKVIVYGDTTAATTAAAAAFAEDEIS